MKELHPNLIKIAGFLSNCEYHSGDDLGKSLAITRSAVWKAIKKLEHYGIQINSMKGKGYVLTEPLVLLDRQYIKKHLRITDPNDIDIKVFASLASTNDYLHQHPNKKNKISICLAETQTQGRGRLGRSWLSPFGKNIYFSCRYSFQKDVSELAGLSLITGLAILKTLRQCGIANDLAVQWPNHIVWQSKKLAGSLIEMVAEANGHCDAIIGIGINVNLRHADTAFPWSSMTQALGKYVNRNEVCALLASILIEYLTLFSERGFEAFKKEWLTNDYLVNQLVSLSSPKEKIQGLVLGINDYGHLLLQTADQTIRTCTTGDIVRDGP